MYASKATVTLNPAIDQPNKRNHPCRRPGV
jgi:hypothetical protein